MTKEINASAALSSSEVQEKLNREAKRKDMLLNIIPFTGLVFLIILFTVLTSGSFLSGDNLSNMVNQSFVYIVSAVGACMIFTLGYIDTSIGMVAAVAELVMSILMRDYRISGVLAWFIGVCIVMVCQSITATVSLWLRVPVAVVALCMMNICSGIMQLVVGEQGQIYIDYDLYSGWNRAWVQVAVAVSVIAFVCYVYYFTREGRDLKALGENEAAAIQSGVKKIKAVWIAFAVMAVCVGTAAFFGLTRSGIVYSTTNAGLGINIITGMVLGGFPITGGAHSKVISPIIGSITIVVLTNGLTLIGVDLGIRVLIKGIIFVVVILLTKDRSVSKFVR